MNAMLHLLVALVLSFAALAPALPAQAQEKPSPEALAFFEKQIRPVLVEKCVSCQLCEFVCPPKAIRITPGEIAADAPTAHVEKAPQAFEIDMLRCIYCGLCQEVCPEEAIFLQNQFSMSGYTRAEMVNDKARLYELGGTLPDQHYKWDKKKAAAEHGNAH